MLKTTPPAEVDTSLDLTDDWLRDYICRPHPRVGRSGPVCPFVGPARRAGSLELRVRLLGPTPTKALMTETLRCALDEFGAIGWRTGSNPMLHSLVVVMPDLPEDRYGLLDEAHAVVKNEAVARGMMIGQFHPRCEEPAARNREFPVSRSPVPLVAIRRMALHDVLFLHERADWFDCYAKRFGHKLRGSRASVDPLFVELFEAALDRHAPADRPENTC